MGILKAVSKIGELASSSSGTKSSVSSSKKINPNKQALTGRWKKDIKKYVTNDRVKKLRNVEINDEEVRQETIEKLFIDISHKTRKAVTPEAIERYLKNSYRNKIKLTWEDKKKIMRWAKAEAKKEIPKQTAAPETKQEIAAKLARQEERKQRVIDAEGVIKEQKFISPKNQINNPSDANSLGLGSNEYKGNHHQQSVKRVTTLEDKAQGLTQTGSMGVTGNNLGGLRSNNINLNNRPRIGGM